MKNAVMLVTVHTHTHNGYLTNKNTGINNAFFVIDFRRVEFTCLFCVHF